MSIATRIQAIEEHISNAYDSLNKLGVTANNKNIENIAGLIDEIYDNSPKTDYVSGTNLTLENTRVGKIDFKDTDNIEKIGLGATDQLITTGKNLLDESKLRQGAFNYTSHTARLFIDGNYYLSAGTYTFVTNLDLTRFRYGVDIASSQFPLSSSQSSQSIDVYDSGWVSNSTQHTFTLTQSGYLGLGISKSNGTDTLTPSDVANYWFMVYSGNYDSSTSYEPYTGGEPSPNPSYPQEIKVVTGSQKITLMNKNLIEETFKGYNINARGQFETGGTSLDFDVNIAQVQAGVTYTITPITNVIAYFDEKPTISSTSYNGQREIITATNTLTPTRSGYIAIRTATTNTAQLEKGTTATSYVKHYEQKYELNLRKNLFNKDDAQIIHAWFLKTSTAISVKSGNDTIVYIPCQPNTTYTASKIQEPNQSKNTLVLGTTTTQPTNNTPLNVKEGQQGGTITEVTITTGPNDYYLCAFCYSKNNANTYNETEMLASLQIEEGSQATSYASYFPPIELCKIGIYQDYVYKNNNHWFIHKEIKKIVLNGTESWVLDGALTNTNRFRTSITSYNIRNITLKYNGFSNQLQIINAYSDESEHLYTYKPSSIMNLYVFYTKTRCADLAGLQTWLSANNLIIYGILNTPTEIPITNENLIAQLDA